MKSIARYHKAYDFSENCIDTLEIMRFPENVMQTHHNHFHDSHDAIRNRNIIETSIAQIRSVVTRN